MIIPNKHSGYQAGVRLYPGGGKGGSSAPPPDPRLIAAQIKSMGIQDGAIEAMLKNANDMLPLQKQQLQFGLDSAKLGQQQSQDDRSWMLNRRGSLSTLQDTLVNDAKDFNSEERQDQLVGQAQADVSKGFSNARDQQSRSMSRMGINPSSGRAMAMGNQASIAQAAASAGASAQARDTGRREGYAMTDRASNALAGYPAMGMAATGAGANMGMAGSGLANQGLAGMNSGFGAAGGMAGSMGSNATSMYGAQASYKNSQDQLSNQGDPMMEALGGAAMKFAMTSDVNQKERIQPMQPGQALKQVEDTPVSEWQYKDDSQAADGGERHIGPMAQDVQRISGNEAAPNGTKIDLISLNGLNMAATKDLSKKVDQLTGVVSKLAFNGGLKGTKRG